MPANPTGPPAPQEWMIEAAKEYVATRHKSAKPVIWRPAKQVINELAAIIARHAPGAEGWVSVEERCPAPNTAVLFWTMSDCWESGYFRADADEPIRWECERTNPQDERIDFYEGQVTHWMIPAPPACESKGEGNGD